MTLTSSEAVAEPAAILARVASAALKDRWCILRTSGARTLSLARSLEQAGYEVWTPVETHVRRKPRSTARTEHDAPIMPTFVFARARHLPELARCLAMPLNPHPQFSIFHYLDRIPLLADAELSALRVAEDRAKVRTADRRAKRKSSGKVIPAGTEVSVSDGSWTGMSGVVEESEGKFALVAFGGRVRVKIATFLLERSGVEQTQPTGHEGLLGNAAQAA
jgi:hypothetical protein